MGILMFYSSDEFFGYNYRDNGRSCGVILELGKIGKTPCYNFFLVSGNSTFDDPIRVRGRRTEDFEEGLTLEEARKQCLDLLIREIISFEKSTSRQ